MITTIYCQSYTPLTDSPPQIRAQEHALGRSLLRYGLQNLYGITLSSSALEEELGVTDTGKPFLKNYPDISFNISHCDRLAACAFAPYPVGVDVELPGYFAEILEKRILSEEEEIFLARVGAATEKRREWFFRFWTLKEAYVKMTGTGMDVPVKEISFSFLPETDISFKEDDFLPASGIWSCPIELKPEEESENSLSGFRTVFCSDPAVLVFQKRFSSGHILSVCREKPGMSPVLTSV